MDSGIIIAALAVMTIGGTLILAIVHFGFHVRDPENRKAVKGVVNDEESATTKSAGNQGHSGKPLLQRLNESQASTER